MIVHLINKVSSISLEYQVSQECWTRKKATLYTCRSLVASPIFFSIQIEGTSWMKNPTTSTPRNLGIDFVFVEHNIAMLKCCVQLSNFLHGQRCRARVRDEHHVKALPTGKWVLHKIWVYHIKEDYNVSRDTIQG